MLNIKNKIVYMYFIYVILLFGYIFSRGFYSNFGAVVLFTLIPMLLKVFLDRGFLHNNQKKEIQNVEKLVLLIMVFLTALLYGGLYQTIIIFKTISVFLLLCYIAAIFFIKSPKIIFYFSLAVFSCAGLLMIWSSPSPHIDVFVFLKEGARAFLLGQNPYAATYPGVYTPKRIDYYAYFPTMIFLTAPSVLLFNDPRYGILAAVIICALIMNKYFKEYFLQVIFLLNPIFLYALEESYTEPLVFLLFFIAVMFAAKKKDMLFAFLLALLIGIKQYTVLWIPFFIRPILKYRSSIFIFIISSILIFGPFLLWNKEEFLKDAVFLQMQLPVRYDGLTFTSLLHNVFKIDFPFIAQFVIWLVSLLGLVLYKKDDVRSYSSLLLRIFIFSFVFFYFNKWSFVNYYYLLSSLLILVILFSKKDEPLHA